jgi:hypothetical protein
LFRQLLISHGQSFNGETKAILLPVFSGLNYERFPSPRLSFRVEDKPAAVGWLVFLTENGQVGSGYWRGRFAEICLWSSRRRDLFQLWEKLSGGVASSGA